MSMFVRVPVQSMPRFLTSVSDNRSFSTLFLFLLPALILLELPFSWSGNEENYFQLALARVAPTEFSGFHAVFDASDGRFFFETFLGLVIQRLGYESAHIWMSLLNLVALSGALAYFFSSLRVNLVTSLLSLAAFHLLNQQIIGGEWLLGGVEAKTFAYTFVLLALGTAIRGYVSFSLGLIIVATYFHFLVGGFWALWVFGIIFIYARRVNLLALSFCVYSVAVLPIVYILAQDQLSGSGIDASRVTELYVSRNVHHVAPFFSLGDFAYHWFGGILLLAVLLFGVVLIRSCKPDSWLPNMSLLGLSYLAFCLVLSLLDSQTFFLAKFYMFRPSSLILLVTLACVFSFLTVKNNAYLDPKIVVTGWLAVFAYLGTESKNTLIAFAQAPDRSSEYQQLKEAIRVSAHPDDIVLIVTSGFGEETLKLHRLIENPTLVSYKFVPTNPVDLVEWGARVEYLDGIRKKGCEADVDSYPVRFLITTETNAKLKLSNCTSLVWEDDSDIALLRLSPKG